MKDCIRIGMENNLRLKNTEKDIQKAAYGISENRSRLLPVIEAFGGFNNNIDPASTLLDGSGSGIPYITSTQLRYAATGGVQLSLPLYDQTLYTGMEIARKMKEISACSYEKAKEDLIVEISKLYYQGQTTAEQIKLTKNNIDRLTKLKNITEAFRDNDMALNVDVKRVDINLESMQVRYDNASSVLEQQLNILKYILNLAPEDSIGLTAPEAGNMEAMPVLAGVSPDLNELKILYTQKEVLVKQKKAISQQYLPTLSFTGQLAYSNYTDHFSNYFHGNTPESANNWQNHFVWGLTLKVPLFDGLYKKHKTNKARVGILQNEIQLSDTQKQLNTEYKNGLNDWANNKRTYKRQKDNYRLAEEVYDVTANQYKEGVSSMSDLLQDEMRMSDAQNNYLDAYYNCKVSELKLLKLTKQLEYLSE